MKRVLLAILLILIPLPTATAASNQIILTDKPYREYDGKFLKNNLEADLAPAGRLGQKVFAPLNRPRVWVIDPALIEDILQYQVDQDSIVALNWLNQLKRESARDSVFATAYANPDVKLANRISPSELKFYYIFGQGLLSKELGRPVYSAEIGGWNLGRSNLTNDNFYDYQTARRALRNLVTVIPAIEVETDRAKLAKMLTLGLTRSERDTLVANYLAGNQKTINKLRVVGGKYRLTTDKEKLPITLVNDFENPVTVKLEFEPLNARIKFPKFEAVELKPKSRIQIPVQVTNIAAGESTVIARFVNEKEEQVGGEADLNIVSSVISPLVAWFTTGAAILLLLAAVVQSVRRIRRSRNEKP